MLSGKKVGLFITGGIAAYKMAELSRQLIKRGCQVRVVMSKSACEFITPLTMQTLTKNKVLVDTFDEIEPQLVQHINMADWCDLAIVAPATANIIAKMANGLADDIVSTTLLAVHCPCLVVPAMNSNMYRHPATQRNIAQLNRDGYQVMTPDTGFLAEGYEGIGRLPELETIVDNLERMWLQSTFPQVMKDKKVVISAGGTIERIDPVRYISNDSTGKMGYAMANAAAALGAEVTLVTTTNRLRQPLGVQLVTVSSAHEMFHEMTSRAKEADILMMAAAVSDYRVENQANQKLKKIEGQDGLVLSLIENPDILKALGQAKTDKQLVIGFAAETQNVIENAKKKITKKNIDWIIANDVSKENQGFNAETNLVTLLSKDGEQVELPFLPKKQLAFAIWQRILGVDDGIS